MSVKTNLRLPAIGCALVLPFCAVIIRPTVESGMMDDWSYVRSAEILCQTGHVVYNGWATAMLGCQLLYGALVFKLFGVSFLAARLSMLLLAVATIFIVHRCMVRLGVNEWNATLGTLTVALTPIMLPLSLSFMTDIPGMLAIMVCLYSCIRALQARSEWAQMTWICFAALGNAFGGTARQIAWLGVLVMVPSTIWIIRQKRRTAMVGIFSCLAGACIVFASLHWFNHQLYSVAEPLRHFPRHAIKLLILHLPGNVLRPTLQTALFLLPVSLMFLPVTWQSRRRGLAALAACAFLGILAFEMVHHHRAGAGLLAPFMPWHGNYVFPFGLWMMWPMHCLYPIILHTGVRVSLTIATVVSLISIFVTIVFRDRAPSSAQDVGKATSWSDLGFITGPFLAAYVVLLMPRGIVGQTLDRYLIPLMPVLLILLLRLYQDRVRQRLPWPAIALIVVVGGYSIATTHDLFATYRGALAAVNELRAAGIPRTDIDGGWEYDGDTQLEVRGYMNQYGELMPKGRSLVYSVGVRNVCPIIYLPLMPDISPKYSLSLDPTACEGPAGFQPVSFSRWLGPRSMTIYIVKNPLTANMTDYGSAISGGPVDPTCAWRCGQRPQ